MALRHFALRAAACAAVLIVATAWPARAQTGDLGDALLGLWNNNSTTAKGIRSVDGSLFGAHVDFVVKNLSGTNTFDSRKLGSEDRITRFVISRGDRKPLVYDAPDGGGTKEEFNQFVRDNAPALRAFLFPTSVSESVSSKDAAQNHAQQFLLNTAMALTAARRINQPNRVGAGGMFEVESLSSDGRSALAFQGMYDFEGAHLSLIGRYSQQQEGVASSTTLAPSTRSVAFASDFHPSVSLNKDLEWRVGIDARTGFLLTKASTIDFGSIDYGGGVWTSARKDFSRVRIGVGSLLQGSRSFIPFSIDGDLQVLADGINDAPIAWDVTYGAIGGYALTEKTSLNGKLVQTRPFNSPSEALMPNTTIVMGSISHLIAGLTPVDIGYKYTTSGGLRAHGIFVQGNYGW
jgi:hypothetical protein